MRVRKFRRDALVDRVYHGFGVQTENLESRHVAFFPASFELVAVGANNRHTQMFPLSAVGIYPERFVRDLERLESPGLELWAFPPLGQPNNPGCSGALVKMKGKDSGTGGTIVYFSCDDCVVEASRAVQNGGRIQKPKESIGQYGFIALVYDTEGNMIGLHSME